jgi:cobalt/nickel transport system permease protein
MTARIRVRALAALALANAALFAAADVDAASPTVAAAAALVSVPLAALAFVGLYAVGGQAPIPLDRLATAMLGWHVLIGLGEAAITGLVVSAVLAVRPDLVHGARRVRESRELVIRDEVRA